MIYLGIFILGFVFGVAFVDLDDSRNCRLRNRRRDDYHTRCNVIRELRRGMRK